MTEYNRLDRRQVRQALIIDILESYGVKVESVTEKFDDSPVGNFVRAVYATVYYYERHGKKVTKRPIEAQIRIPDGIVPPIISVECFNTTQEQLARNKQFSMRNDHHPKNRAFCTGGM